MDDLDHPGSFILADDPDRVFASVHAAAKYAIEAMPAKFKAALAFQTERHEFTLAQLAEIYHTGVLTTPPWQRRP